MAFSLQVAAHSEIGLVRRNNQDSAYASPTLIVVADGMGGAAAGDLASSVAIERLAASDGHYEGETMLQVLSDALADANDELADLIAYNPEWDGMGTTVCGALFSGTQLGVVHIGDSRGYLLRDGELTQLTHDHSWVQSLIDGGQLTPEEAAVHPKRSLLIKVLNGQPGMRADLALVDVQLGDRIMFCSDGLSGLVELPTLTRLMRGPNLSDAVRRLAAAARRAGGYDNITLVLAQVVESDDALLPMPPQTLGAASQVRIPDIPSGGGATALSLSDGDAEVDDLRRFPGDDADDADDAGSEEPAPRPVRRRRRWVAPIVTLVIVLAVVAGGLFGAREWLDRQFYVGASGDTVAIFQGAPDTLAGISLNRVAQVGTTRVADLPPYYADQVRTTAIRPDSLAAAQAVLADLDAKAQACIAQRAAAQNGQPTDPAASADPLVTPLAPSDPEACS